MAGAILSVTVPDTTIRSAWRGPGAKGITPNRMKSCRAIDAAMNSMAQQARPKLKTHRLYRRPQLRTRRIGSGASCCSGPIPGSSRRRGSGRPTATSSPPAARRAPARRRARRGTPPSSPASATRSPRRPSPTGRGTRRRRRRPRRGTRTGSTGHSSAPSRCRPGRRRTRTWSPWRRSGCAGAAARWPPSPRRTARSRRPAPRRRRRTPRGRWRGIRTRSDSSRDPRAQGGGADLRWVGRREVAKALSRVMTTKSVQRLDRVVIRFAGDSGDGMQLTGDRFTAETAALGNDLATFPSFPAEIRSAAGTLAGVSSFQLHFADHDVLTPGDQPDVLVAMNPAALRANVGDLPRGGVVIVDSDSFSKRNLAKVGYTTSPLEDDSLSSFQVHDLPLTSMTAKALEEFGLSRKDAERSKNMFALGLLSWLYDRPTEGTERFVRSKFASKPDILEANLAAFRAGWAFGETTEAFAVRYEVAPAEHEPGTYRNVTGNVALAYGLVAAAHRSGLGLLLGSYPITPASDILHTLSGLKRFGITTIQAEDEIAGVGAALGAAFGGSIGVTTTSGPGLALKSETISLAVSLELPLVVIDVQRGGPSTGLPTKTCLLYTS